VNRDDFQQLAEGRLLDAQTLIEARRFTGAFYLAGYAVECALKACIAKQTRQYDFPDRTTTAQSYTHDFAKLIQASKLDGAFRERLSADPAFAVNWALMSDWSVESRYAEVAESASRAFLVAIEDPLHGVMSWLRTLW
jgi:hypothetical protein